MKKSLIYILVTLALWGLTSCKVMINPTPEISVFDKSNNLIKDNTGSYDFGEVIVNKELSAKFYIGNTGKTKLKLTGTPVISITGQGSSSFQVTQEPEKVIDIDEKVQFQITFTPTGIGNISAKITIENNDIDESNYSFTLKGKGIKPAINVYDSSSNLIFNKGSFDFGKVRLNQSESEDFKIVNEGTSTLQLTGNPKVEISSLTPNVFAVTTQPDGNLSPGSSSIFTIKFTSQIEGSYTGTVTILNSDVSESPYIFTIKGEIAEPEIKITDSEDNDLKSWFSSYSFGDVLLNEEVTETFTIYNLGSDNLILSGLPRVEISASVANCYKVITQPYSLIAAGESTTFTIQFKPTILAPITATVTIANNDADEGPFGFYLTGTGVKPEINVKHETENIVSGSTTIDFGSVYESYSSNVHTFTIENTGTSDLHLNGSPKLIAISGSGSAMFDVIQTMTNSKVVPNGSTTFTITFSPTALGNFEATISIANDDSDENPFTFIIKGAGLAQNPEINVRVGTEDIPNSTGTYKIENIAIGSTSQPITFTIENLGVKLLQLTGSPVVEMNGASVSEYTLDSSSTASDIQPNGSTTFTIVYKPVSTGVKIVTITIKNNDTDENPYIFTIKGINQSDGDYNDDGYPDILIGSENAEKVYLFFGSSNPFSSSSVSVSTANVVFHGEVNGDDFGFSVANAGDFNNDGIDDIIIGARQSDDRGSSSGCVYIFYGSKNLSANLYATSADITIRADSSRDELGWSVACAGDFNKDGIDDVVIGAPEDIDVEWAAGAAFVVLGSQNPPSIINLNSTGIKFLGQGRNDNFGYSVSSAGDFNCDGYDDIIVGAVADGDGGSWSGCAFVFKGGSNVSSPVSGSSAHMKIIGEKSNDHLGQSVSYVGDFNNDGKDDILIGAPGASGFTTGTGAAYLFYGATNHSYTIDASNADIIFKGHAPADSFGISVSYAGDLNNDGISDVIIGAYTRIEGGDESGCAYTFYGSNNPSSSIYAWEAATKFIGQDDDDYFGRSVSQAGDFNNDGYIDVIIGAPYDDDGGDQSGCVFLFYGKSNPSSSIDASNADVKIIGGAYLNRIGHSVFGG